MLLELKPGVAKSDMVEEQLARLGALRGKRPAAYSLFYDDHDSVLPPASNERAAVAASSGGESHLPPPSPWTPTAPHGATPGVTCLGDG